MINWAAFTTKNREAPNSSFPTLSAYLTYRNSDVANDYILTALRYSCEFDITQSEVEGVVEVEDLLRKHCSLTNDLYSFDKEHFEHSLLGAALVNAVQCLKGALSISTDAAKIVTLGLIWDVENQMHQIYEANVTSGNWSSTQILYAERLIEVAAGNAFYSATAFRYSKEAIQRFASFANGT